MKVYAVPDTIPEPAWPEPFSYEAFDANNDAYKAAVKAYAIAEGATGPRTGDILQLPGGDGAALYMYCDAGAKSFLLHLRIGDCWQNREVQFLPRKEVLRRIDGVKAMQALFSKK